MEIIASLLPDTIVKVENPKESTKNMTSNK